MNSHFLIFRQQLEKAAKVLQEELGPLIKSGPDGLKKAAEIVNKEPFTQESMEQMFLKAAMNLPKNNCGSFSDNPSTPHPLLPYCLSPCLLPLSLFICLSLHLFVCS